MIRPQKHGLQYTNPRETQTVNVFATRMPAAQHTTQTYSPITALSPLGPIPFHPSHLASTKLMRYCQLIQFYLGSLVFQIVIFIRISLPKTNALKFDGISAYRVISYHIISFHIKFIISSFPNCHNFGYTLFLDEAIWHLMTILLAWRCGHPAGWHEFRWRFVVTSAMT